VASDMSDLLKLWSEIGHKLPLLIHTLDPGSNPQIWPFVYSRYVIGLIFWSNRERKLACVLFKLWHKFKGALCVAVASVLVGRVRWAGWTYWWRWSAAVGLCCLMTTQQSRLADHDERLILLGSTAGAEPGW